MRRRIDHALNRSRGEVRIDTETCEIAGSAFSLIVGEREHPPDSGLVPTARYCGRRRHRQTNSVRVCSPASRRVAALRPRFAGLTALTPAPRTLVQTGSCRRCPLVHPLHVVVDALFRMTLFPATVDSLMDRVRLWWRIIGSISDATGP